MATCVWQALSEVSEYPSAVSDKRGCLLGSSLTYLLMERLRLDPSWPIQRWLDCIQWNSLISAGPNNRSPTTRVPVPLPQT